MATITTETMQSDRVERGAGDAVACPAAGLTTVATFTGLAKRLLCFHFAVATQALDDFDILVKAHTSATLQDITPANWMSLPANGRVRASSGNLPTTAAAANGYFELDITGLSDVVVKASGAVNNASVTPYWSIT